MELPKTIKDAITSSVSVMCASFVPPNQVNTGLIAMFDELEGRGALPLVKSEPIDRVISRESACILLSRSPKVVSALVKSGRLRGVYGGVGAERITGISEQSIRDFIAQSKSGKRRSKKKAKTMKEAK